MEKDPERPVSLCPPMCVRGDIDGFFALFTDNLLQLMLIAVLCPMVCGLPLDLVFGRILPGAAISILVGNIFYGWQARRLMHATGRNDVTALPYGINTPSLFAFVFLIMGPVYRETGDSTLAWQVGIFACFLSGILEMAGALVADWLRRNTPRAALLTALAGVALTFIAVGFVFQIFANPLVGVLPMVIILITYGSRSLLPGKLPGGLVAVVTGIGLAWGLRFLGLAVFEPPSVETQIGLHLPQPVPGDLIASLVDGVGLQYLAVVLPMTLFNVLGSLQNLESAEAAGDRYETKSSLLVNGAGTVVAAMFGSAFPTTIYIGHPAWKSMGARAGYSTINGVVIFLLCLGGIMTVVLRVVPLEATLGILLWVGIVMAAQAFQEVPKGHAIAVAFGLIPAMAAWALHLIEMSLRKAGVLLVDVAPRFGSDLYIAGLLALSQGFLLTAMVVSATLVYIVEGRFDRAGTWMFVAAALSFVGVIHAYELTDAGVQNVFGWGAALEFSIAYALSAGFLLLVHIAQRRSS